MALYPHLRGDLDAEPELLKRLDALAARLGKVFNVTSGKRTDAEQAYLYAHPQGFPVAKPRSLGGSGSNHETGNAADVYVDGRPIQNAIPAPMLRGAGLEPLAGDAVHVQLTGAKAPPRFGSPAGAAASAIPIIGPIIGAADRGGLSDELGNAAGDATRSVAEKTARALVGVLVDAIGRDGARVLLAAALVLGALVLIVVGTARAAGVKPPLPLPPQLALARAAMAK